MTKKITLAGFFTVLALVLAVVAGASSGFVSRGLPTANLNNAAGSDRSNVAWSQGNDFVTGDSFSVGSTGEQYSLDSLTVWNIGAKGVPFHQQFKNVTLYLGGSDGEIQAVPATFTHSKVTYADGSDYQGSEGATSQIFQDTFTGLNVTLNGGETYYFAVDGISKESGPGYWYNHASNAALSGSQQDGADNLYYTWSKDDLGTAIKVDSQQGAPNPNGDQFAEDQGGWDKSSDINVSLGTTLVTPPVMTIPAQIDRDGACTRDTGKFEDLTGDQINTGSWTDADGVTHEVVPAPFVAGVGLTCDTNGVTWTGQYVTGSGDADVIAPQFNTHPLYK